MAREPSDKVWILADERIGNVHQCLGVAEALDVPYRTKRLAYNRRARLPNLLLGRTLAHLKKESAAAVAPPWPDIVIAAGRRTVPVARTIKRRSGERAFLVQLMWPGAPAADLNLIATPAHDRIRPRPNLLRTVGAPNHVTPQRLAAAREAWRDRLAGVSPPRIAALVGGDTRHHGFTPALARELGRQASDLARKVGGSLMISTSRRTGAAASEALMAAVGNGTECHLWRGTEENNPYLAYLALSDILIVTGDSTSMCTEACATGRPVYIFAPDGATAAKHRLLHERLYARGCARPLTAACADADPIGWRYRPLNDAETIAREILRRTGL